MIKKILGIGFIVLVVGISVWYYSNFVYVPKGQTFDIKFLNLERIKKEGNPNEEKIEFTKHGLYTRINFFQKKEQLVYKFDALNDGTLDAKLKYNPIFTKTDMYFKKHINYRISYLDGEEVKAGDVLKAGESTTFKVTIDYTVSDSPTQNSQFYESSVWLIYVIK